VKKSEYKKMKKKELIKLLIAKNNQVDHLKHIIKTIDVDDVAKHLTGDPDEYITVGKRCINNNPSDEPIPFPF
jgi:hypothetical protein